MRKIAVSGTAELDQFEEVFRGVFEAKPPRTIAIALRAFSRHLNSCAHSMRSAKVMDRLDAENNWKSAVQICPPHELWGRTEVERPDQTVQHSKSLSATSFFAAC